MYQNSGRPNRMSNRATPLAQRKGLGKISLEELIHYLAENGQERGEVFSAMVKALKVRNWKEAAPIVTQRARELGMYEKIVNWL